MAISFEGTNSAASTSVSIPAHQAGDLLIITASRNNSTSASLPSGWTNILNTSSGSHSTRVGYRIAPSSGTVSGTWSNASTLIVSVYRGVNPTSPIGAANFTSANSGTVNFPALTLTKPGGTSWVYSSVITPSNEPGDASGLTKRNTQAATTWIIITTSRSTVYDSAGGVGSWTGTSTSMGSSNYVATSIELVQAGTDYFETVSGFGARGTFPSSTSTKASSSGAGTLGAAASVSSSGRSDARSSGSLTSTVSTSATGSASGVSSAELPLTTSLNGQGNVQSEAVTELDAGVGYQVQGAVQASAQVSLPTHVEVESTGRADATASGSLEADASTSATGVTDATAETSWDLDAASDPNAQSSVLSSTSLDTSAEYQSQGAAQTETDASWSADVTVSSTGRTDASASGEVLLDLEVFSTSTASVASGSEGLVVSTSTEPESVSQVYGVADLWSAVVLLDAVESSLGQDVEAPVSVEVSFSSAGFTSVEAVTVFQAQLKLGPADSDAMAVPFSVLLSLGPADSYSTVSSPVEDLSGLVILEGGSSTLETDSVGSPLSVDTDFGTAKVRRELDWSIYIQMSEVVTSLPFEELVTSLPDLGDCTCIPTLEIVTSLPQEEIVTRIDDPSMQTSLPETSMVTQIPSLKTVTLLEEEQ